MANGGGGSRIGGFIRGVLLGLIVCAIGAVALSLWAPPPERAVVDVEVPGAAAVDEGAAVDGTVQEAGPVTGAEPAAGVPETAAAPGAGSVVDVTVVPPDAAPDPDAFSAPADEGTAAPQPTFQAETAAPESEAPASAVPNQ